MTATGYDWSETDGLIGLSDLEGFGVRGRRMRTVLPWRLLLDTAAAGFRLDGADGVVRGQDLEHFVHDRRIPEVVRRSAWELYSDSDPDLVRDLRPFEPTREERADRGPGDPARWWGAAPLGGSRWLANGRRGRLGSLPGSAPVGAPAEGARGPGGSGLGGLVAAVVAVTLEPAVDAAVDRGITTWDRARSLGMPSSFVVLDLLSGQPVSLDTATLAGLAGDEAVAVVFWAAATGRPPVAGQAPESAPDDAWIDDLGLWRDGQTNRLLAGEPAWMSSRGVGGRTRCSPPNGRHPPRRTVTSTKT